MLLEARDVSRVYPGAGPRRRRSDVVAVDGVSLGLQAGEILGLVGESGSGKSTLARLLLRLERPTAGSISWEGRDVWALDGSEVLDFRRSAQIIFQDPFGSLNPRITVGNALAEVLRVHGIERAESAPRRAAELLERVGLSGRDARRYPHEFSGGQRQRIVIARALAVEPNVLVADEPVSALDVSVQAQILGLLTELHRKLSLTYLFISHDLAVVRQVSDRIAVMRAGRIVELGPTDELFEAPRDPYTRSLLAAVPRLPGRSAPSV